VLPGQRSFDVAGEFVAEEDVENYRLHFDAGRPGAGDAGVEGDGGSGVRLRDR
jgi:hypothetical protein